MAQISVTKEGPPKKRFCLIMFSPLFLLEIIFARVY
jgi:hypothetical protein